MTHRHWIVGDSVVVAGSARTQDRIGSRDNLAWVVDGATPVSGDRGEGDVHLLVDAYVEWLCGYASSVELASLSLSAVVDNMIVDISSSVETSKVDRQSPPSAAIGLVRAVGDDVEYLVLSDVSIAFSNCDAPVSDNRVTEAQSREFQGYRAALAAGHAPSDAFQAVRKCLADSRRRLMNKPEGYWVASLDVPSGSHAVSGVVSAAEDLKVLLCTDGFARIWEIFDIATVGEVQDSDRSLNEWVDALRSAERSDPQCAAFPRWGISDDAAAIRLTLS